MDLDREEPMAWSIRAHGIWYVSRDGRALHRLDEPIGCDGAIPRPERDVAIALMRYALELLEAEA